MENYNEKLSDQLEHLLSICNDGKEGYKSAGENVNDPELQSLFMTYSNQRSGFASELKSLLSEIGGERSNKEGGPLGYMHRAWMDIKAALTGKDRSAILNACITGDSAALNEYDDVLADKALSRKVKGVLYKQRQGVAEALETIQKLEQRVD